MSERMVSMEEVEEGLKNAQREAIFFLAMKEMIEEGDTIMFDEMTGKYRSVKKGMPVAFS